MGKIQIHISFKVCGQALPLLVQGFGDKDKVKLQPEVETASLMQISAAPGNKSSTKSLTNKDLRRWHFIWHPNISGFWWHMCESMIDRAQNTEKERGFIKWLPQCKNANILNKLKNAFTSKINLGWQSDENLYGCCGVWRTHSLNCSGVSLG